MSGRPALTDAGGPYAELFASRRRALAVLERVAPERASIEEAERALGLARWILTGEPEHVLERPGRAVRASPPSTS